MIQYRKILELDAGGISYRSISSSTGHSRKKISEVVDRAKKSGIDELTEEMTNQWLEDFLFPEKQAIEKGYFPVNLEEIHKELMKKNVTLKLLHQEYEETARLANKIPYAYRTFCENYGKYAKKYKLTMPIRRKPGEIMEADWAGSTLNLTNRDTGEKVKAYVFIATLPYSQLSYVEAFVDMKSENWLTAHMHAFEYFGGVTETLVPDNLKTGVTKHQGAEPVLNEGYRQLADHYGAVVVPARVRAPKDKASVEGTVGFISRQIIASLRNYQCFCIHELNKQIREKLTKINAEEFQKRPGSRKTVFEEEEKSYLQPLPQTPFRMAAWRTAKAQLNYHIQVERMYYSVPYEYVQNDVDVRITKELIEVYLKEVRIASHKRLFGEFGQFSTNVNHMPDNHRRYIEHTPSECMQWAEAIGESTTKLVEHILKSNVEKKALGMLMTLKNQGRKFSKKDIEAACQTVLEVSSNPTVALVKTVLERNKKRKQSQDNGTLMETKTDTDYGFARGANYFGGKSK